MADNAMPTTRADYDDPAIEEVWCDARRKEAIQYLKRQNVVHGSVGEWPAWHLAPYVSIWAIESASSPGWVGWWLICGDLPADYASAESLKHPREALRAFGQRWQEAASCMARGESHPDISVGLPEEWPTLAPLLLARARSLLEWADDDELWDE